MSNESWDLIKENLRLNENSDDPIISMMKTSALSFSLHADKKIFYLSNYWFEFLCRYCKTREQVVEYYFEALSQGSVDDFSAIAFHDVKFKKLVRFKVYLSIVKKGKKISERLEENDQFKLKSERSFKFLSKLRSKVGPYEFEIPQTRKDLKLIGETLYICTGGLCHTKRARLGKNFRITLKQKGKIKATLCFYKRNKTFYALEYQHKDMNPRRLERIHKALVKMIPELSTYKPMTYQASINYVG